MRVYNPSTSSRLSPGLQAHLDDLRAQRGFDVESWILAKVDLLNDYFRQHRLSAAVIGLSGGIDSSVVVTLLHRASQVPGSALRKVVPMLLPAHQHPGVTGQDDAVARGRLLCQHLGLTALEIDVAPAARTIQDTLEQQLRMTGNDWMVGQLVPYTRTPVLYGATSLLTQCGWPAIVVGTTNRDEGAYLGYVGKASDGMVDVQVISDLHKSEVRAVARALNLPAALLDAPPTGDMFDRRTDEEVFGAPYDAVELLLLRKTLLDDEAQHATRRAMTGDDRSLFEAWERNLERLHDYNAHKYLVGSPAVHLDVYPSAVPGGWNARPFTMVLPTPARRAALAQPLPEESLPPPSALVALPPAQARWRPVAAGQRFTSLDAHGHRAGLLHRPGLSAAQARAWFDALESSPRVPAPDDGRWAAYTAGDHVGTERATCFHPGWATRLWEALAPSLPSVWILDPNDPRLDDFDGCLAWHPVGINPVLRCIRYADDGRLLPHYDGPTVLDHDQRTLLTVVLYLNDTTTSGGALRFLQDTPPTYDAQGRMVWPDSDRPAADDEGLLTLTPAAGDLVVFDHRRRHEVGPMHTGQVKWVVRTDVVFERCGHGPL